MYKGSIIDDLIQSVVLAEQHLVSAEAKKSRPNVQAYAMYMYEYYRPEATGAFEVA